VANLEQQNEKKYLAIRNWSKFQSIADAHGKSLEGRRREWIRDYCEKETDSVYAELSLMGRYLIDACRRLRGKLGRNLPNDHMWILRQLDVHPTERGRATHALEMLVGRGLLVPTNEQHDKSLKPETPLEVEVKVETKDRVNGIDSIPPRAKQKTEIQTETDQDPNHAVANSDKPEVTDRDIELVNVSYPSPQWDTLSDADQQLILFCRKISEYSGVSVKPSWIAPAREVFDLYGADDCFKHMDWIFRIQRQIPNLKFYWADCTKSTKNFRDHMKKGALIEQIYKWLEDFKRVETAKAKKAHSMSEGARAFLDKTGDEELTATKAFEIDEDD
jgi:hypothetical protein